MAKSRKARTDGKKKIKDLGVKDGAKSVTGGRKAGTGQQEYLIVKMTDVLVTGLGRTRILPPRSPRCAWASAALISSIG